MIKIPKGKMPLDQKLGIASFIFGALSLVLTGANVFLGELDEPWLLAKDAIIFGVLLYCALQFYSLFRDKDKELVEKEAEFEMEVSELKREHAEIIRSLERLLSKQNKHLYNLMNSARDKLYRRIDKPALENVFKYQKRESVQLLCELTDSVVSTLAKIISNTLEIKFDNFSESISLSVKILVDGSSVKHLHDVELLLEPQDLEKVDDAQKYVITVSRDPHTQQDNPEREIRKKVYSVNVNTAFSQIYHGPNEVFKSNNLKELAAQGNYKNENENWSGTYNATLVVPIQHNDAEERYRFFGFFAVDCLNAAEINELFSSEEIEQIMEFGSNLLAMMFLTLDLFDSFALESEEAQNEDVS